MKFTTQPHSNLKPVHQCFVSRIAIRQILEIDEDPDLVLLRLCQNKNNFLNKEVGIDKQAKEPTMPFQNIIYLNKIPPNNPKRVVGM